MRTWSWAWAVELMSIHWNILTDLICVHWDYANRQVCFHIWENSLLSPEWLRNLLLRLLEDLTLSLQWTGELTWGDPVHSQLDFEKDKWDLLYHVFHANNNQTKHHKGYCVHCIIHFHIFFIKGSDFIIYMKPSHSFLHAVCYHMVWTLPNREPIYCRIKQIFAHSMPPPANAASKAPMHAQQRLFSQLWLSADNSTVQEAEQDGLWKLKRAITKACKWLQNFFFKTDLNPQWRKLLLKIGGRLQNHRGAL